MSQSLPDYFENIFKFIDTLELGNSYIEEGSEQPNQLSRNKLKKLAEDLYIHHKLIPLNVVPVVDNGIALEYHTNNKTVLLVECYNEGEVCGIIYNNALKFCGNAKTIINLEDLDILVKEFNIYLEK